ncbi:MAG: LysR family transcriptional regulator, partial [Paracoccaceae bacterium]
MKDGAGRDIVRLHQSGAAARSGVLRGGKGKTMDIGDLTLFVRIARLASISAAARDLGMTPAGAG